MTFLKLCIENNILQFGEFKLKSGRVSPYFFNAGNFNNGYLLGGLCESYAQLIAENLDGKYMLYGPAYKGIPLAAGTAIQLSEKKQATIAYAFNRKEAKDHGEGGNIVGAKLSENVVVIDDVITAGTSVHASAQIIEAAGAKLHAIVIALDRQEVADGETTSAVNKVEGQYGVPVLSIIKLEDLIRYIAESSEFTQHSRAISQYRERYGLH